MAAVIHAADPLRLVHGPDITISFVLEHACVYLVILFEEFEPIDVRLRLAAGGLRLVVAALYAVVRRVPLHDELMVCSTFETCADA